VNRVPRSAWVVATLAFALHAALGGRYGFFRDELYFIVCGRHPAFGYVDQPPLVPLLAAASQGFGTSLELLRLIPAFAHAATILTVGWIARRCGGGTFAVAFACAVTAGAPVLLGLGSVFVTSSFEPLWWALLAACMVRVFLAGDERGFVWAGLVVGVALEMKYAIAFDVAALGIGVLASPQRRALRSQSLLAGTVLATLLAAPSFVWQAAHGWPILEVLRHGATAKNVAFAPLAFVAIQLGLTNVVFAPLWLAGVAGPFVDERLTSLRPLSIAFVVTFVAMAALHAKEYYLAPLYPAFLAIGAVVVERRVRAFPLRAAWLGAGFVLGLASLPVFVPLLPPATLAAYLRATHLAPPPDEMYAGETPLPQWFADQFGWPDLARAVASAYARLTPAERADALVLTDNYGEAAAIDFFGPALGLPPASSGHNQYDLWGTHGRGRAYVLSVDDGDARDWASECAWTRRVGTFGAPFAMAYEVGRPILLCRLRMNTERVFAHERHFG
jgi:hypothetical protein